MVSCEYAQWRYINAQTMSFLAYCSPSSRRMSFSSTITRAGGKPFNCSSVADKGDAVVFFRSSLLGT